MVLLAFSDAGLRLFRRAHGHESEATWAAALAIRDQAGFEDAAVGGKHVLKIVFIFL